MQLISLSAIDLSLAAALVILVALVSAVMGLGIARNVLVAGLRTTLQLLLVGLVLKIVFERAELVWVVLIAVAMVLLAGREVMARQKYRLSGSWGYGVGTSAMFLSSFVVTLLALTVVVNVEPWYKPQYAIPLLGMLLGNTMTGIALGMDQLTNGARTLKAQIEGRLMLGQTSEQAIAGIRREAVRSGMIPMINAMAAAGIVSLPGMMTGQILAGAPPVEAVKYQIMIMFLIAAGTSFGVMLAAWLASKRLFDSRQRLRLDRLKGGN